MPYLDIVRDAAEQLHVPVAVYQVRTVASVQYRRAIAVPIHMDVLCEHIARARRCLASSQCFITHQPRAR